MLWPSETFSLRQSIKNMLEYVEQPKGAFTKKLSQTGNLEKTKVVMQKMVDEINDAQSLALLPFIFLTVKEGGNNVFPDRYSLNELSVLGIFARSSSRVQRVMEYLEQNQNNKDVMACVDILLPARMQGESLENRLYSYKGLLEGGRTLESPLQQKRDELYEKFVSEFKKMKEVPHQLQM